VSLPQARAMAFANRKSYRSAFIIRSITKEKGVSGIVRILFALMISATLWFWSTKI
jgi:hypothetical protein